MKKAYYAIFDVETTGILYPKCIEIEKQPKIIELCCFFLDKYAEPLAIIDTIFDPKCELAEEITRLTGITKKDTFGKKPFEDWIKESYLLDKLKEVQFFIAHNAFFDFSMLKLECERANVDFVFNGDVFCTVDYYQRYFNKRPTLKQLYKKIIGESLVQRHRAYYDVKALHEILLKDNMYNKLRKTCS